jgi:hypothetical protein
MANLISWEVIDQFKTADEIACLMRYLGVMGRRGDMCCCPLARATGWKVTGSTRIKGRVRIGLSSVAQEFARRFDAGSYKHLSEGWE